ncbi:hypothetical protein CAPTEDRAFT_213234 [Capitella teleta]|uniref:DNA ligase n=1 Tax=Capitella teleta TaxID=283909 RepID=R7UP83_CAPTE|nr:hypothetical protein CAPTEDRAFT_213234 [Capitella teleta]|eukprot:ELU08334.1 hypothetical protein CAPTEDRAFT_213234 [Capitella teleta]
MTENRYACDYAKRSTSSCKKCKKKLEKGEMRLAKVVANYFNDGDGEMKQYHHASCLFETFVRARATTKIIESPDDVEGFGDMEQTEKDLINRLIKDSNSSDSPHPFSWYKHRVQIAVRFNLCFCRPFCCRDNAFRSFRRLCAQIAEQSSYLSKTKIVSDYLKKGSTGDGYHGDAYLLLKLLLPGVVKTVYNLNSKQLVKIFSQIFGCSQEEMVEDLEKGDAAETVRVFFEQSKKILPTKKSLLSIQDVDESLNDLSQYTKEDDQMKVLMNITKRCTANDLKMVVRLIKHDLRISAGAKHILDGLDANAYEAFKASRDLKDVVDRVFSLKEEGSAGKLTKSLSIRANLMTAVQPMLAEACKSVDFAFKRCPNGMYAEIKYDGERVQVHKQGSQFQYFSRSLKPVLPHKVNHFKDYIPKAFPGGSDLILDSEVLLIDTQTSKPLPFGSLGVHKKQAFKDASVCLFIFDCIHYNGESLMLKPLRERRKILKENMTEIPNHIMFSEMKEISKPDDLSEMMMQVFREGLEGLVLKDAKGIYEPGKRHWLKVKKDYLAEGAMADSADLVVLGAYFGTGVKGGLMSVFLMGVYDSNTEKWCSVTKCHLGFDDDKLDKLQKQLDVVKISKDYSRVPSWLNINRQLAPDFVVKDPKKSPVWEITGAEFSKADIHTAGGISIRFPRCTKVRNDKSWKEATDLTRLRELFRKSKEYSDLPDLINSPSKSKSPFKRSSSTKSNTDSESDSSVKKAKLDFNIFHSTSFLGQRRKQAETKNLPNVFSGMKFHLPAETENYSKLKRFIIAYDGELVDEFSKDATHYVVSKVDDPKKEVTVKWLRKCIMKKQLLPSK